MDAIPQVQDAEFDALHDYLASFDASDDCMLLSELDGFLTGLVLTPQPVAEAEWLPVALGDPPVFASDEQRDMILDIIRRRVAFIAAVLRQDPEAYAPVFWTDPEGKPIADDWANGFRRAMAMRDERWMPLLETLDDSTLLAPIMALWDDVISEEEREDSEFSDAVEFAPELITESVIAIHRFWYRRARSLHS
jgi:uncharacterized protein